MLFNRKKIFFVISVLLIFSMYGCNLEPIHKNNKEDKLFCAIELQQPKSNLIEHEIYFYNNLKTKFCKNRNTPKTFLLQWSIKKSNTGLITSQNASISRYEILLTVNFNLINKKDSSTLLSNVVYSKAAHNVLEDELFSTITAERNASKLAANNLVEQIFYKILLFNDNTLNEN